MKKLTEQIVEDEKLIAEGGGEEGRARQKRLRKDDRARPCGCVVRSEDTLF